MVTKIQKLEAAETLFSVHGFDFLNKVVLPKKFNYANLKPSQVLMELRRVFAEAYMYDTRKIEIVSEVLSSKTVALHRDITPNTIILNELYLGTNTVKEIASSIMHEFIHVADQTSIRGNFGHPTYIGWWNRGSANISAPYWFQKQFEAYLSVL